MIDPLPLASVLIPSGRDFAALRGEIVLILAILAVLLVPFFWTRRSNWVSGAIAFGGLMLALVLTFLPQPAPGYVFGTMGVIDPAAILWEQILLIFMLGVLLMWLVTTRHAIGDNDGPEFFTLLLSSTVGMMLMGQTTHLLMVVLVMEIASMPSYILAGFRKTRRAGAEGALKFVLFGAVCTATMIYGISLLYGTHGSLDMIAIAKSIQTGEGLALTTVIGLLAVFVGLLFKISGVPLHFWAPDVLEGTTADIAAFLSVASKGAGLILLARLATLLAPASGSLMHGMTIAIGIVSVMSMIVGNLGAMQQTSLKRMLAFSSIAHAGYMLAAVAMLLPGRIDDAMTVLGVYLSIYLFMQLGAFAVVAEVEARSGNDRVESFRGLITLAPLSAIGLAIAMLSMIGLPPFGGFWAKLLVMVLLAQQGGWWWVIVASVAINSIISIGFYGRVLRAMFLDKPPANTPRYVRLAGVIGAGCALTLFGLFIFLSPLQATSARMADQVRSVLPVTK